MVELNINNSGYSNMTNRVENVVIETRSLDSARDQDETTYINTKWTTYLGIYKTIPEVKVSIDTRAIWTIGNGYQADPSTTAILDNIRGCGNDTFNSILKNLVTVKRINGDAFAEVMRDNRGTLINLKPLDPGSIQIVTGRKGEILRYEQINKTTKGVSYKFKPKEIFHLINKKVGNEMHGVSDIEALQDIINANKESFADMRELMHRFVRPKFHVQLDTDDETKINSFIAKFDHITNKGENLFTPMKTTQVDVLAIPANATLNPLPWREHLKNYFYQVVGIPQIIMGGGTESFTEASSKIAYLAFEQSVDDEQNDIEAQIWNQLAIKIKLTFPASLRNDVLSDQSKDSGQMNTEMNSAGMEE